jgi:hypothetical protein
LALVGTESLANEAANLRLIELLLQWQWGRAAVPVYLFYFRPAIMSIMKAYVQESDTVTVPHAAGFSDHVGHNFLPVY